MENIDLLFILPELFLLSVAIVLLVGGVFIGNKFTPTGILLGFFALLVAIFLEAQQISHDFNIFHGMLVSDNFIALIKYLLMGGTAFIFLMIFDYVRNNKAGDAIAFFELPVLIILSLVGMMIMIAANDFLTLYIGLEMQSLSLYILAASQKESDKSSESGLKYFVLGALASGLLLYGISMIYGFTGTTNFTKLAELYVNLADSEKSLPLGVLIGVILIVVALCFKISAVPFHMWTPDVYEGAPTNVTAFFASVGKISSITLFVRVLLEGFGGLLDQWYQIIIFVSAASMILGAVAAIRQKNIKRLMAYSSIGHIGYILMGLAVATGEGIEAIVIYISIYLTMSLGAFTCILLIRRNGNYLEGINDLAGIAKTNPVYAFILSVFMLSMAGIPPLAGFFGKFYIFMAAINVGLYWLALVGIVTSVIAAFYYLNIIKVMYFDSGKKPLDNFSSAYAANIVLFAAASFNILFIFYPSFLIDIAKSASSATIS